MPHGHLLQVSEDIPVLVAYIVSETLETSTLQEVRGLLGQHLPEYMLPQHVVRLQRLPVNPNGASAFFSGCKKPVATKQDEEPSHMWLAGPKALFKQCAPRGPLQRVPIRIQTHLGDLFGRDVPAFPEFSTCVFLMK